MTIVFADKGEYMGKLVMGYWDCPYCKNQGILGSQQSCPACGRARGDVKFYMKDNAQDSTREENERSDIEYVDEEKAAEINRNPDWYCSFCNSLNHDDAEFCTTCGASRKDSEMNYFDMRRKEEEKAAAMASPSESQQSTASQQTTTRSQGSKKPLLILLVVVLAIIALVSYMNGSVTGDWKVTDVTWERAIQIEEYKQFSESGWTLPAGAEQTGARREIFTYQSILDHYENREVQRSREVLDHYETYYTYSDSGNGYFEEIPHQRPVYRTEYYTETVREPVYRQQPVYQTKYYYNIKRWTPVRAVDSSGKDHNPYWPEFKLSSNEREGQHAERYRIYVSQEGKNGKTVNKVWIMKQADWAKVNPNDAIFITANRTGQDAYISDKDGNKLADLYNNQ